MSQEQNRNEPVSSEAKLAVLQRDVLSISDLFVKVDATLNKLTDTAASINKILAVQDARIATGERNTTILEQLIEKRTSELNTVDRELNVRISTVQQEIKRDFEEIEDRIMAGMKELKEEIKKELSTYREEKSKLESRVETLERWRWIVVGAGIVIGFIFSKVNLAVLLANILS